VKKNKLSKLVLSKETLRNLAKLPDEVLVGVEGGQVGTSDYCTQTACYSACVINNTGTCC
jgi:hypothetical protein